jgi:hypothetical protein
MSLGGVEWGRDWARGGLDEANDALLNAPPLDRMKKKRGAKQKENNSFLTTFKSSVQS